MQDQYFLYALKWYMYMYDLWVLCRYMYKPAPKCHFIPSYLGQQRNLTPLKYKYLK